MTKRIVLLVTAGLALAASAFAQAHIALVGAANPTPAHRQYSDVWAEGNYAYVGSDASSGVQIFDISNPTAPTLVATYGGSFTNDMEDVKVVNGIGYFASNLGGGVHIVDLSDPVHPKLLARLSNANGGYDSVHNVSVDNGLLYMPDYPRTPAVKVFDVTNPAAPVLVSTFQTTDSLFIQDLTAKDGRLYTSGWGGRTDIYDVTTIRSGSPVLLGSFVSGSHSHSCWPDAAATVLACTREISTNGELQLFDISDPAHAVLLRTIVGRTIGLDTASPGDPRIVGTTLYVSFDQAGLAVFDISDPANPLLIGNYDTWPGPVLANFDGNWGVFPDLGADRVLLSDRDTGLYIVDATAVSSDPVLLNLRISPTSLTGGKTATVTGYLVGRAPAGGLSIDLTSSPDLSAAPLVFAPGDTIATAAVSSSPVATQTVAAVSGAYAGPTVEASLTINVPTPIGLSFTPNPVITGSSTTAKVTLDGPAAVDTPADITVISNGQAISTPASVVIAAGSTSAAWPIDTQPVAATTTVQISVAANGKSKAANLSVQPNAPTSVTFSPTTTVGSKTVTGKVTFGKAVSADTTVTLAVVAGQAAVGSMPASVVVPSGSTFATWALTTAAVDATTTVQVSATANGGSKTGSLTVTANVPASLTFSPTSLVGGNTTKGTVTFGVPVVADTTVALSVVAGQSALSSIPASVLVPAGATSATFNVTTTGVAATTTVQVSAVANGGSRTASFSVTANIPSSVSFTPTSVVGGNSTTAKVTFAIAVPADTTVQLTVTAGQAAVASMQASVVVPAGSTSATWAIATNGVSVNTAVQITAAANGGSRAASFTVTPNTPSSVSFTPISVIGGLAATGKVTFAVAVAADTTVQLKVVAGAAAVGAMPSSVVVPAGTTAATWSVPTLPVSAKTTVQISGTVNGVGKTGSLTVNPNTPISVSFSPTYGLAGISTIGKVTFGAPAATDTTVQLAVTSGQSAVASMPSSVVVPAGSTFTTWTLVTTDVSAKLSVVVGATANGLTRTGSFVVYPNVPTSVTFSPTSVHGGATVTGKVSFGRALATDTVITLSVVSGAAAVASMPPTVTIPAGASSVTWTFDTAPVAANTTLQVSAAANGGTRTGSMTIVP